MPEHCKLAVVGAGWGGAYFAWRLAIDDATLLGPSDVCIFEANNRVGGRVFSVRDLPGLGDMAVDVGGYRFKEEDLLPAQLVWDALKLPTACYDYNCSAQCEGGNCYVVKDAYGNNAGYATPVETMLGQIEDGGAGQQVFFGKQLAGVYTAHIPRHVTLGFKDGTKVTAERVLLNIPAPALEHLDKSSVIFTKSTRRVRRSLAKVSSKPAAKVYAYYADAWWCSKLGLMEGYIYSKSSAVPLAGRYHDGPLKCIVGHTPAGDPVYSGEKVPFGNCSGALEVYYNFGDAFFQRFMTSRLKPLTVWSSNHGGEAARFIGELHSSLMEYHSDAFQKAGIEPTSISKPALVMISNWLEDAAITPSCGMFSGSYQDDALIRAPASGFDIYVADVDYGYSGCWAAGSLIAVEKVLQAKFGVGKPSWLEQKWYEEKIVSLPLDVVI